MTKSEKLLRELIALPSVNPAFLQLDPTHTGEHRVAEYLASIATQAKLEVEFQPVLPGRANLLARLTPARKVRTRILLAPHLDTVNATDPAMFKPRVRAGRLVGRGACDTKGSIAAMFTALLDLALSGRRPVETEIVFAGLVDEENSQSGSRALAASGLKADLAVVGEPTRNRVVTAHKGSLWLKLETRGRAAHGSRPELGSNAVHTMARVVDLLETKYARSLGRRRHPLLGCATISVGAIAGGTQANIVPDYCSILIDRRTLPGEKESGVWREIRDLLAQRGLRAWLVNGKEAPCLPLETDPALPLVRQLLASMGQSQPAGVHYFCDASVLAHDGIPSVVFGPGDIAQAHTIDEWISLEELERAKGMVLRFLETLP
jgi:acetylornithine deacetylase/succinyl-diaminopimelate desuccinylase-like protein